MYNIGVLYGMYMYVCVYECMLLCHSMCAESRGQSAGVSYLPSCGSQRSNSDSQAWWQSPLPTEPSHRHIFYPSILLHLHTPFLFTFS